METLVQIIFARVKLQKVSRSKSSLTCYLSLVYGWFDHDHALHAAASTDTIHSFIIIEGRFVSIFSTQRWRWCRRISLSPVRGGRAEARV